ncbi:hypothetical protein UY3_16777 [Chelonia mydas]|uniref:Uncharacterized protein n=1 Tax=Chelonia mydas TaxID=8469 RepID=M7B224_CHEMY|nr:hypothetical protein UY3_16777 [Chelonia mydas]
MAILQLCRYELASVDVALVCIRVLLSHVFKIWGQVLKTVKDQFQGFLVIQPSRQIMNFIPLSGNKQKGNKTVNTRNLMFHITFIELPNKLGLSCEVWIQLCTEEWLWFQGQGEEVGCDPVPVAEHVKNMQH